MLTGVLDAFNAGRLNSLPSAVNPLPFETVMLSNGSCIQSAGTNQSVFLSAPTSAIYWMHLSIDVPAHTQARFYLVGTEYQFAIIKNHTSLKEGDTMIRDGVVSVTAGQRLTIASDYPTDTTGVMQPYWAGFRLDNYFNPLVVVSVACTSPTTNVQSGQSKRIIYDRILVNIGSAWNATSNLLIVPFKGIYLFSCSAALLRKAKSNSLVIKLVINGIEQNKLSVSGGVNRQMIQDNTTDFISRTFLLSLNQNDQVTGVVLESTAYSDTTNWQVALHAVLYSPQVTTQVRGYRPT